MIKVRGLQTAVGEYGMIRKGRVIEVRGSTAAALAKEGIAEIVSEDDGNEEYPAVRGGVRITDATGSIQDTADGKIVKKDVVIGPGEGLFETSKAQPEEETKATPAESEKAEPAEVKKAEPKETAKKK